MQPLYFFILLIVFALWWGGLTFYALFVIPVGTEAIGSVAQGFITQKVTLWHNRISLAILALLAVDAYRNSSRWRWAFTLWLTICTLLLMSLHAQLSQQLDFQTKSTPESFYNLHAIYLWLTTAQWLSGLPIAWTLFRYSVSKSSNTRTNKHQNNQ
jgi:hypothetical protein